MKRVVWLKSLGTWFGFLRGRPLGWISCYRGTGMFVAISLPLVSNGNAFSGWFRTSDDF